MGILQTFLHSNVGKGMITGVISAAAVDIHAFKQWKSYHDAATYGWGLATFRWLQGAAVGAMTGLGLGAL